MSASQYVCVMSCPAFADWVHVSACSVSPEQHAAALRSEFEVDVDFLIEGYAQSDDAEGLEESVKAKLASARQSHDFYEVKPLAALAALAEAPDPGDRMKIRPVWAKELGL